jgi:hypothetical protein
VFSSRNSLEPFYERKDLLRLYIMILRWVRKLGWKLGFLRIERYNGRNSYISLGRRGGVRVELGLLRGSKCGEGV